MAPLEHITVIVLRRLSAIEEFEATVEANLTPRRASAAVDIEPYFFWAFGRNEEIAFS
ncbi:MAG TPA: hypothetical protein VFU48_02080 [Nitrospira sp.]|nr:hypothetical protein [Nitrospira sp.]